MLAIYFEIVAATAFLIIPLLICLVVFRKRKKRATQEQSRPEPAPLTPDVERLSVPSAPPAYDHEMAPTTAGEALPSYDEVAANPNRFKSRSSISRISSIFRKNNG